MRGVQGRSFQSLRPSQPCCYGHGVCIHIKESTVRKWKILFWLVAFFTLLDFIGLPFKSSVGFRDLISLFMGVMLLAPYYGYSYRVAIGGKVLWQVIFVILVALSLLMMTPLTYSEVAKILSGDEIWLMRTVFLVLGVSVMVVLAIPPFRYAFKSQKIWDENA